MKLRPQMLLALVLAAITFGCEHAVSVVDQPVHDTNRVGTKWAQVQSSVNRCNRLIPQLTSVVQAGAIADREFLAAHQRVIAAQTTGGFLSQPMPPQNATPEQVQAYEAQRQSLMHDTILMGMMMRQQSTPTMQVNVPSPQSQQLFGRLFDEIVGCENRIQTALDDYALAVQTQQDTTGGIVSGWIARQRGVSRAQQQDFGANPTAAPTVNFNQIQPSGGTPNAPAAPAAPTPGTR